MKSNCCLDNLQYFSSINGLPPDLMHDWLEGSLPKAFSLTMEYLISKKLYSVNQLNADLKSFVYGRINSKSKVPHELFSSNTKQFSLSATHQWTLIQIIPFIIGYRFRYDEYVLHYLSLIELFRTLTDDCYNHEKLLKMADDIETYIAWFKILYPTVKLTTKIHNMAHYPRFIRVNGPPLDYWAMRFESKHHNLKRIHFATNNHINLLSSLANRHQNTQLYHTTSTNYFQECSFGSIHTLDTQVKDFVSLHLNSHTHLQFYNYIKYHGIKYTIGDIIVIKRKTNTFTPTFAKILTVANDLKTNIFYLITDELITVKYVPFLTGYMIDYNQDSLLKLTKIIDLVHFAPIDCYHLKSGEHVVIPKYEI